MKTYDFPDYEGLSPEAARKALSKFSAEITADRDHPLFNPQNYAHAAAVKCFDALNEMIRAGEADTQADATAKELEDALGDDVNLSPAECWARAKRLIATPGYLIPEPGAPRMLDEAREKLHRKINALQDYAARVEGEERANAEAERASGGDADDDDDDADEEL